MRGDVFTSTEQFVIETCYSCHVPFAMTKSLRDARVEDKKSFYCPNGHSQHYTGKTEAQTLREQLEEEQRKVIRERNWRQSAEERVEAEKRRHAATKGKLTKTKKRIANGVCPECNRHFPNVQAHMETEHPAPAQEETVT